MLSDLWPYALLTVALVAAWAFALAQLGYPDVVGRTRLAPARGPARLRRAADPAGARRRAQPGDRQAARELDLRRLLAIADRDETDAAFLGRTAFLALLAFTAVLAIDVSSARGGGDSCLSPGVAVLAALAGGAAALRGAAPRRSPAPGEGRSRARRHDDAGRDHDRRPRAAGRGLGAHPLALRHHGGSANPGRRRLAPARSRHHAAKHRGPVPAHRRGVPDRPVHAGRGRADDAPMSASRNATRTRASARAVYQQRLAEARVRAARARILVTLPVAGMLIPLLLLLGAPTFQSITTGLGGG